MLDAQNWRRRVEHLHAQRVITHAQYVIARALFDRCRGKGQERCRISYARMARIAGVAVSTAKQACRRLRDLGLLGWVHTHVRVMWRRLRAANVYWFAVTATGSEPWPAVPRQARKQASSTERLGPQTPVRTVEEQLRLLLSG
jgi:hypothetical protein